MTTKAHTVITFMAGVLKGVLQETFEQQQFIRIYIYIYIDFISRGNILNNKVNMPYSPQTKTIAIIHTINY